MLTWRQVCSLALWNLGRLRRRFPVVLPLFLVGYLISHLAVLLVTGIVEVEYVAMRQAYGGDPRVTFVWRPASGAEVLYQRLITSWLSLPEMQRIVMVTRSGAPVNWAGIYYAEGGAEGFPPLLAGRYFTPDEIRQNAAVALVGRTAGAHLVGSEVQVGQVFAYGGREWTIIGLIADELPVTGSPFAFGRNYVWVPLASFHSVARPQDESLAYLYLSRPPSNETEANLRRVTDEAVVRGQYDLRYANDSLQANERLVTRLLGIGVGAVVTLYAAFNLSSLMSYWVARRRYELKIRRYLGATTRDLARMILAEQAVLIAASYVAAVAVLLLAYPWITRTGLNVVLSVPQLAVAAALSILMLGASQLVARRLWLQPPQRSKGRS